MPENQTYTEHGPQPDEDSKEPYEQIPKSPEDCREPNSDFRTLQLVRLGLHTERDSKSPPPLPPQLVTQFTVIIASAIPGLGFYRFERTRSNNFETSSTPVGLCGIYNQNADPEVAAK
ncbi:hypothetical protein Bbelb_369880 [Branchiostoma belcheri]|nr:hypothetical protein Bbelb_369880 [Branchiostoma belcheri]